MKRTVLKYSLLAGLLFTSVATSISIVSPAEAKFAGVQVQKVPVERLLANLEKRLNSRGTPQDRAMLAFQIGRLHSMAYAYKTEEADCREEAEPATSGGSEAKPFYGVGVSDYNQFEVVEESDSKRKTTADGHLRQAIVYLNKAIALDPKLTQAKLGLAWSYDQSRHKLKALQLYRAVLKESYEKEKTSGGFRGTSVVAETVDYMIPLLDPKTDAKEIADIKAKKETVDKNFRAVTPIVVSLKPGVSRASLMQDARISFDLDGNGPKMYASWPTLNAGWLVYDKDGSGIVSSGLDLFGRSTFWIFWKHGYDALSALDADNDGVVEGAETEGLAIWQDANCNGVSDPGEVRSLKDCGIASLSCRSEVGADGFFGSPGGVHFTDGKIGESVDWVVEPTR